MSQKPALTENQVRNLNRLFGFGRNRKRGIRSHPDAKFIEVPEGQKCPLCPDHQDDEREFVWSPLLKKPVCWGCKYDSWFGFYLCPDESALAGCSSHHTILRILEITGLRFQQAKFEYLREYTGGLPVRNKILKLEARQLSDVKLHTLNSQIEYELEKKRINAEADKFNVRWEERFAHVWNVLKQHEKGCIA